MCSMFCHLFDVSKLQQFETKDSNDQNIHWIRYLISNLRWDFFLFPRRFPCYLTLRRLCNLPLVTFLLVCLWMRKKNCEENNWISLVSSFNPPLRENLFLNGIIWIKLCQVECFNSRSDWTRWKNESTN